MTERSAAADRQVAARLLVVEDDPVFRRFVLAALQEARLVHVEAGTAASLAEALQALARDPFDCVLLDLGLPDSTGLATVQAGTAASLAEALQALAKHPFDCVLLDLGLPDSTGLATVQAVLDCAPAVPVVVLTGEEDGELADQALQAGAQDFLEKTQLEPSNLGRAIRHAVDRGRWMAQLADNNRELEARNRDLDDFAHAVSHDLKAPLRGIFHLFEEARSQIETRDIPAAQQTILEVLPRIRRLFDMIDGILRLTTAGRLTDPVPVDVGKLVNDVVASLEVPAGFEVRVAPEMPNLLGEGTGLGQVFQNLVDNAIKHHPGPTGTIEVAWRDLGSDYEFTVVDDGNGIPPEHRQRVFELFQTLGTPRQGSTGIGLALVRKVVQANGGAIAVEDNAPRGARFRFTWPKRSA
ncbi:MAG TPA: hybrid sensor histidine kinase/response regulator [Candidatus Thermoplasmatota archaeon]|nr:hybrid sensor histidine kinase/response regulator [Candidatus Thermoplasmatota archaeon]